MPKVCKKWQKREIYCAIIESLMEYITNYSINTYAISLNYQALPFYLKNYNKSMRHLFNK